MAKKQKEKLPSSPPPPSSSSVSSSSEEEESPRPAASALKKTPGSSTVAVPPKGSDPSSNSRKGKESGHESDESVELSHDGDSSDDSGAVAAKSNPPPPAQDSRKLIGKETSKPAAASESSSESSEDSEEEDSSSESDQPPRAPSQAAASAGTKRTAPSAEDDVDDDDSEYSSDSDRAVSIRSSSRNAANPWLKPLNSKPMDSHVQPVERSSIFAKGSAPSTASMPEKKSNADARAVAGGDEEKIVFVANLFSRNDELALLQGILDYKASHHIVPSTLGQIQSFLQQFNAPMSSANSLNRIYLKVRKLKEKYMKFAAMENPKFSYAHDNTVHELSKKIWGSSGEEDVVLENKIGPKKTQYSVKKVKEKGNAIEEPILLDNKLKPENDKSKEKAKKNQLPVGFPSLHRLLEVEHTKNASLLPLSHIPNENANEFEAKCKKLDITEIQLQVKKQKLLGGALKLIQVGLTE